MACSKRVGAGSSAETAAGASCRGEARRGAVGIAFAEGARAGRERKEDQRGNATEDEAEAGRPVQPRHPRNRPPGGMAEGSMLRSGPLPRRQDGGRRDRKPAGKGQRDPFVSPIVERPRTGANCTGSGRQCLLVGDIVLQGVVRYTGGYIAVVTSGDHTYFLHDNDPLADGDVERITKDSITLRQRSTDILGRPVVHEVTKKLGVPAA